MDAEELIWTGTKVWRDAIWPGYVVAILAPLISGAIRIALGDMLIGYPYLTFFPAVLFAALIGDLGAAVLAIFLSAGLASTFAIDSNGSFFPQSASAWIGTLFFLTVCATIVTLIRLLYGALRRLDQLNAHLELRVRERTQELSDANAKLIAEAQARQEAEARMRQAEKMQAIGRLTGGLAHDFNNMLAVMISALDLAQRRLAKGSGDVGKFIDGAMDAARRAATLTQRLLSFSRQAPLQPVPTDLNRLVSGVEDLLRRTMGETIRLEFVLGGGIWQTNVDATQLETSLLNLAVNARDAMPEGGRLTIETQNSYLDEAYASQHNEVDEGQYVMIAVSDTGSGMPPEVAERVFEPFFTTKEVGRGTGLGLSQVYGFVKQSGGHVKVYTEAGRGTTIRMYLKRAAPLAVALEPTRVAVPNGEVDELVLVVEDEPAVRKFTVEALRDIGYTVRHAASGQEALNLLEQMGSVSLLFTDVVMPGMSGKQLADVARERRPELKVLYMTGYTRNAIVHNGVVDQGAELLSKPFTIDELARKVRKVIAA